MKSDKILESMAVTFRERNNVYGDNYKMVLPIMAILLGCPFREIKGEAEDQIVIDLTFPQCSKIAAMLLTNKFHLVELIVVKLTRFAVSWFRHVDSIHDVGVYAAMTESILTEENDKPTKPSQVIGTI